MSTAKQTFDDPTESCAFDADELRRQIEPLTIFPVRGGRFVFHADTDGSVLFASVPLGNGREVVVQLNDLNRYEVSRVLSGRVLGVETDIDRTQIGLTFYKAGMFEDVFFGDDRCGH